MSGYPPHLTSPPPPLSPLPLPSPPPPHSLPHHAPTLQVSYAKFLTAAASAWTSWFYGIQYRFATLTITLQWGNDPIQFELNRVLYRWVPYPAGGCWGGGHEVVGVRACTEWMGQGGLVGRADVCGVALLPK